MTQCIVAHTSRKTTYGYCEWNNYEINASIQAMLTRRSSEPYLMSTKRSNVYSAARRDIYESHLINLEVIDVAGHRDIFHVGFIRKNSHIDE